jgi:hypothetical protein
VQFTSRTNWLYTLERTVDFSTWDAVTAETAGTGGAFSLTDANPLSTAASYRVRANRP